MPVVVREPLVIVDNFWDHELHKFEVVWNQKGPPGNRTYSNNKNGSKTKKANCYSTSAAIAFCLCIRQLIKQ